jgi:hypothetical protein
VCGRHDVRFHVERVRHHGELLSRVLDGEHVLGHVWTFLQHHLRPAVDLQRDRRRQRQCLLRLGDDLQRHVHGVVLGELWKRRDLQASMLRSGRAPRHPDWRQLLVSRVRDS